MLDQIILWSSLLILLTFAVIGMLFLAKWFLENNENHYN